MAVAPKVSVKASTHGVDSETSSGQAAGEASHPHAGPNSNTILNWPLKKPSMAKKLSSRSLDGKPATTATARERKQPRHSKCARRAKEPGSYAFSRDFLVS